jgi:hypothetical protein
VTVHEVGYITNAVRLRRRHALPEGSTPRVGPDEGVKATDTLAVIEVPRQHRVIDVWEPLEIEPEEIASYLNVVVGDDIERGEVLAARRSFLGLRRWRAVAPIDGRIVKIDRGRLFIEGERERVEVEACAPGHIVEADPNAYVVVESVGAVCQLVWGSGEVVWATLKMMDPAMPGDNIAARFNIDHRGAVVVTPEPLDEPFLNGSVEIGVRGIVAPSMSSALLPAIAESAVPVGLTQGFGDMAMSEQVLNFLRGYNGREMAFNFGTRIDSRRMRPEIIIPLTPQEQQERAATSPDRLPAYAVGQSVRVLQPPHTGLLGTVSTLPDDPRRLPSGLWARGAVIDLETGESTFVPFANLEYLD